MRMNMDQDDNDDDEEEEEDEHHDSVSLRKYNATMQNILIVMIKILRIEISIIIKKNMAKHCKYIRCKKG